ncbi:hypothetical protein RJZ56_004343 [Blastomyces dermatitidis]
MDMVAATAAESKALSNAESMKMASRKVSIRVVTLYTLCMLTASFLVPYDHPFLNGEGQSESSHSIFLIAVVQGGLPAAAHFFNAIYLFSAFASGINTMYVSSRVLHTLALRDQTGPEFITRRLRQCHNGVPLRAVSVTGALMCLGYLGTGSSGQVPVFFVLIVGYKLSKHGLDFSHWGPERSNDLRNCVQVTSGRRKGRLQFPDDGLTKDNLQEFVQWVWVWTK